MSKYITTPKQKDTIAALWRLQKMILDTLDFNSVVQRIADSILSELGYLNLGYRIIVLSLVDPKTNSLRRISISRTKEAKAALEKSPVHFQDIAIPLSAKENVCIKVLDKGIPITTHSLYDVLRPVIDKDIVDEIQKEVGLKTMMVYPIVLKGEVLGTIIFTIIKKEDEVGEDERDLLVGFTDLAGLAVQNARLYSRLADTTEKLKKANIRLRELDDLKDEFVSIASHELRTPMTAIKSYLWLAINKAPKALDPQLKKYLDISYKSTERLIRLVNDMLTVSRIERNKIELNIGKIDFYDITQQVFDELSIKAQEKSITFKLLPAKSGFYIKGDKEKMREVIQNLVGNALKFTPDKGKVTLTFSKDAENIYLTIADTGTGIATEDMDKLFQKFQKLEYSYTSSKVTQPGSGLGLYISKQIVSLHDGKITVESKVGEGTTFTICIPKA